MCQIGITLTMRRHHTVTMIISRHHTSIAVTSLIKRFRVFVFMRHIWVMKAGKWVQTRRIMVNWIRILYLSRYGPNRWPHFWNGLRAPPPPHFPSFGFSFWPNPYQNSVPFPCLCSFVFGFSSCSLLLGCCWCLTGRHYTHIWFNTYWSWLFLENLPWCPCSLAL